MSKVSRLQRYSITISALACFLVCACGSTSTTGSREYSTVDGSYAIWIHEYNDNVILGSHCFVMDNGNLIDCNVGEETSVVMLRNRFREDQQSYQMLLVSEYRETVALLSVQYGNDTIRILTNDSSLLYETANVVLTRRNDTMSVK